jgi:lysophospholipase L1-like esterase
MGLLEMDFLRRGPGYASLCLIACCILLFACNSGPSEVTAQEKGAERWLSMHKNFVEQGRTGKIDLLFLGDSITEYWLTDGKKSWNNQFTNWRKGNFGISGDTTHGVLWRLNNGELDHINPEAVVLLIGTNDISAGIESPEKIAEHISEIVSLIRKKLPESSILLLGIFPRGQSTDNPARPIVSDINQRIAGLDDGKYVRFLDIGPELTGDDGSISPEIMPDFLHLSAKGYLIWAEAIKQTLQQMLG